MLKSEYGYRTLGRKGYPGMPIIQVGVQMSFSAITKVRAGWLHYQFNALRLQHDQYEVVLHHMFLSYSAICWIWASMSTWTLDSISMIDSKISVWSISEKVWQGNENTFFVIDRKLNFMWNPGVDKVRQRGAVLPGNDKKKLGKSWHWCKWNMKNNFQLKNFAPRKKTLCPPLQETLCPPLVKTNIIPSYISTFFFRIYLAWNVGSYPSLQN